MPRHLTLSKLVYSKLVSFDFLLKVFLRIVSIMWELQIVYAMLKGTYNVSTFIRYRMSSVRPNFTT
jgi:hypothetical protein